MNCLCGIAIKTALAETDGACVTQDNRNLQRHLAGGPAAIPNSALLFRVRRTGRRASANCLRQAGGLRWRQPRCSRARSRKRSGAHVPLITLRPGFERDRAAATWPWESQFCALWYSRCGVKSPGWTRSSGDECTAGGTRRFAARFHLTAPRSRPRNFRWDAGVGCRAASPGCTAAIRVASEFPLTSFPSGLREFARARTCADGFTILAGMDDESAGSTDPDDTGCRACGSGHSPHRAGNWSVPTTGSARRR